ncbi:type II toxin-antitoxin system ParD family antitoxin [Microseira sp. BLCC-F43]|uniref:ribbon-helix-helix domain-containing protein n=1 Tax=Microseira sp. BLCC-F43 TaxID=3153602 RepID=UPI0035BA7811
MNITLKPEQEQFIQSQIDRGIFANPEQAIEAALRLLEDMSINYEQWLEETRQKVEVGLAQLERGEKFPLEVAFERLERKVNKLRECLQNSERLSVKKSKGDRQPDRLK